MSNTLDPQSKQDRPIERDCFSFTLHVAGHKEATEDLANALFAAGCDDAIFGQCDGQLSLDFERVADSFAEAIQSAIANVESVPGLGVTEVLPEGARVISEVNAFLKVRREGKRSRFRDLLGD